MVACDSTPQGKSLESISNATKADSLIYYFGEMRGAEYVSQSASDSSMNTPASKQAFLKGVKAGLDAVKAEQDAYNRGLFLGMQMAMNIDQFKKDYGVDLSKAVFMDGIAESLSTDSVGDTSEMQREFYRIMSEFQQDKEKKDNEASTKALSEAATKQGFSKINDNLYSKISGEAGEKLKDGDKVKVDISIKTLAGKEINAPLPTELTIGQRLQGPLNEALLSLSSGQKGEFLTSAQALFGPRASQLDLEPADVLVISIAPTLQAEQKAEN